MHFLGSYVCTNSTNVRTFTVEFDIGIWAKDLCIHSIMRTLIHCDRIAHHLNHYLSFTIKWGITNRRLHERNSFCTSLFVNIRYKVTLNASKWWCACVLVRSRTAFAFANIKLVNRIKYLLLVHSKLYTNNATVCIRIKMSLNPK